MKGRARWEEVSVKSMNSTGPWLKRKKAVQALYLIVAGRSSLVVGKPANDERLTTNDERAPLLTRWTQLQVDCLMRAFLYLHRRAICFLRFQKVGVDPDWLVKILPSLSPLVSPPPAPNTKTPPLLSRSSYS